MKWPITPVKLPTFLPCDHSGPTKGVVDIYMVTKAEVSEFSSSPQVREKEG